MMVGPVLAVLLAAGTPATLPGARRLAVLVGANAAPAGRHALRFAHRDAEGIRDVLVRVGGVSAADAVLLLDPEPAEIVATLARLSGVARAETRETVLYFYYSGHADESSLYPGGKPLPIETVRKALVDGGATVRVGIFDACRGGAWTRAKGLSTAPPVELRPPWVLASEGTVLFASSSGLEEAHESDRLQASFFTHHLIGGLLGAADTSGDGTVTATEAFQYAQAQTVRDSAISSLEPQHPSFELNLHGRNDLVLAQLQSGTSTLAVEQASGPLQIIELPRGLVLLELPEGKRSSRLSLPPGQYLVRRVNGAGVVTAREVTVATGQTSTVDESSLVFVGKNTLEAKGPEGPPRAQESILPARDVGVSLALGVNYTSAFSSDGTYSALGTLQLNVAWSPLDWLEISFLTPGVSFLLGTRQRDEVIPSAGVDGFGYGSEEGLILVPSAGAAYRHWFSGATTTVGAAAHWSVYLSKLRTQSSLSGSGFVTHTFRGVVSLNFALGLAGWPGDSSALTLGSAYFGFRTLPLIRIHLSPVWSIDLDAQVSVPLTPNKDAAQKYLLGFSAIW